MAQLLDIFAFVSVLLRGFTLAFEALTVGGVIFLLAIARNDVGGTEARRLASLQQISSLLLALTQIAFVAANSAILMSSTGLSWDEVMGARFCVAGAVIVIGAACVGGFARARNGRWLQAAGCVLILYGAVSTSHSIARLEHRALLTGLTLAHHVASAAWIGAMPYLLSTLRATEDSEAGRAITSRFSTLAMVSVGVLVIAGGSMAFLYVGSASALAGVTYGIMLSSKVALTVLLLLVGGLNWKIVRSVRTGAPMSLLPSRRFGEAEVGIGFTIILAAASLTSTPPAIDVIAGRVPVAEIAQRMKPTWPRMWTPALEDVAKAKPKPYGLAASSFVPGQSAPSITQADIEWSEYNHHWSGLVVLAAGVLSLFALRMSWARHWPLTFLGLAVFLFVRADAENWPLGPRGFWESFKVAEVAQHRLFVLLIIAFGIFEWAVRTKHLPRYPAGFVFPLVCAVGGALLLTHSHSLGNIKEEFLAEVSHTMLAILAVMAGWSRWLELRLPVNYHPMPRWPVLGRSVFKMIWPVCFVLIGIVLLNYREA